MFTVELEQIGSTESACGRTYLFSVSSGILSLSFSRISNNVTSCIFHPSIHVLEVIMAADACPEFEIDFRANLGINVFDDFQIHDFPYHDGVSGTFIGACDGNGETPQDRFSREVDYTEITKQISTGSPS